MLYGKVDTEGWLAEVFNDATLDETGALPQGAIAITEGQFNNRWSWRLVDGKLVEVPNE